MKNEDKEKSNDSDRRQCELVPATPHKGHRKTKHEHTKPHVTGLDLSLFEGHVPTDTICAFCRRVLVQPEVSSCQHVFCAHCLRSHSGLNCPICEERLQATSQQPPPQLTLKLLNLIIHCDNKCGQVMLLGQLPQHVKKECPNAPVPCMYVKKGCRMNVKRCELQLHSKECDCRPVQCEACGEKTTYRDIVPHQKRNQCVENRIKNQLIQAVRVTRLDERSHKTSLDKQRVHMDLHQRRTELEHTRRLTTARVQRRIQQNYQLQRSHSQLFLRTTSPLKTEVPKSQIYGSSRHETISYNDPNTQRENPERQNSYQQGIPAANNNNRNDNGNAFVTNLAESEDGNANGASELSVSVSRDNVHVLICKNCNKPFKRKKNMANSCRWHPGPIVEVFGGTCFTCGRLDYQTGCTIGFHET